jgi:hypothetical protein
MKRGTSNLSLKLVVFILLASVAHSFAIIRPPYPAKPLPPYRGRIIGHATGGNSIPRAFPGTSK